MQSMRREENEGATPFRAAFAEARREIPRSASLAASREAGLFEVRIEKRRGRRADMVLWNELGRDGWELVAVAGKQAFFRRERRSSG